MHTEMPMQLHRLRVCHKVPKEKEEESSTKFLTTAAATAGRAPDSSSKSMPMLQMNKLLMNQESIGPVRSLFIGTDSRSAKLGAEAVELLFKLVANF